MYICLYLVMYVCKICTLYNKVCDEKNAPRNVSFWFNHFLCVCCRTNVWTCLGRLYACFVNIQNFEVSMLDYLRRELKELSCSISCLPVKRLCIGFKSCWILNRISFGTVIFIRELKTLTLDNPFHDDDMLEANQ